MISRTLDEAIIKAVTHGPASGFRERISNEVRDWAANRIASLQLEILREGAADADLKQKIVVDTFNFLFGDENETSG